MTAATLAESLHGRRNGSAWMAPCPIHEADGKAHNPSLAITDRGGKVLVKCHGGCDQRAVIAALKNRGLWPEGERREHPPEWGRIVRTYNYTNEDGALLYQVCRFEPKTFRPRRPDGKGGWKWGYGDVRRVLYRLREVLEASIVFITEGERDVETLRGWGFAATTNSGGANGWRPEFNEFFRGRDVFIIPDMDEPGLKRSKDIAKQLVHIAARLFVLLPQDLAGCKDITAWFEAGHSEVEFIHMLEREFAQAEGTCTSPETL